MFILHAVQRILLILKPADQQLQERETDILTGIQLVTSIIQVLKRMREDGENTFKNINDATLLLDLEDSTTRRRCVAPRLLEVYVTQSSTGHRDLSPQSKLKGIMYEIIDSYVAELQTRFSERNIMYVKSMLSLWPLNENFLAFESISPLANLMQFSANDMEALQNESLVPKPFLLEHFNRETHKCLGDICTFMRAYKTAFPKVYTLLVGGATFGASTATCEASFSTLSRILTPFRQSMTHQRKANLEIMSFLHDYTRGVDKDVVLREIAKKNRRLQLF